MLAPLHPPLLLLLLLARLLLLLLLLPLLLLHSQKLVPDGQESLARGGASPDLSASAQEVVAEFVYAGRLNPPGTHHLQVHSWDPTPLPGAPLMNCRASRGCSWGCSSIALHDGAMAASATDAARATAKVVQGWRPGGGREEEMELEGEKGPCSKSATP